MNTQKYITNYITVEYVWDVPFHVRFPKHLFDMEPVSNIMVALTKTVDLDYEFPFCTYPSDSTWNISFAGCNNLYLEVHNNKKGTP